MWKKDSKIADVRTFDWNVVRGMKSGLLKDTDSYARVDGWILMKDEYLRR